MASVKIIRYEIWGRCSEETCATSLTKARAYLTSLLMHQQQLQGIQEGLVSHKLVTVTCVHATARSCDAHCTTAADNACHKLSLHALCLHMQISKSSVNLDLFLLASMLLACMQERETRSRLDVVTVPSYLQRGPPADPGGQLQAQAPERADSAAASQSLGAAVSRSLSLCCSTVLLVHSQVVIQFTCNRYQTVHMMRYAMLP